MKLCSIYLLIYTFYYLSKAGNCFLRINKVLLYCIFCWPFCCVKYYMCCLNQTKCWWWRLGKTCDEVCLALLLHDTVHTRTSSEEDLQVLLFSCERECIFWHLQDTAFWCQGNGWKLAILQLLLLLYFFSWQSRFHSCYWVFVLRLKAIYIKTEVSVDRHLCNRGSVAWVCSHGLSGWHPRILAE